MVETILPAYLYQQYNNDPDLLAFFTAYNNTSQGYLDQINSLNLPIYTKQSNKLLDWVGNGIYGIPRPVIPFGTTTLSGGEYDANPYDTIPYNEGIISVNGIPITSMSWSSSGGGTVTGTTATPPVGVVVGTVYIATITGVVPSGYNGVYSLTQTGTTTFTYSLPVNPGSVTTQGQLGYTVSPATDDVYKRVITWNFYKGDGYQFNTRWLKNRIYRFLTQENGISTPIPNTYKIGVTFSSGNNVAIAINPTINSYAPVLSALINSGALQLPFQYTFTISY
jgi:hypothetical protein